ncbi:MAG TPA: response regulator [Burkholderiaceae bacterium]|jgi:CheY-like chemotaxis protein
MKSSFPFAVRFIGFSLVEAKFIESIFAEEHERGYGYFRLMEDNLQDPDLYLVNANDLRALASLSDLHPSAIRPALLVGTPGLGLPYPCIKRPLQSDQLLEELDKLVEKRADALSKLEASDIITVPERRRRNRLNVDLTDPTVYERMRRTPVKGGILVVDKSPALRDFLNSMLNRKNMSVDWVDNEEVAASVCRQRKISTVLINTSTPNVDPYRLCELIKKWNPHEKTTVIFLVGKNFSYDPTRARHVGYDGFLNKPLASHHLMSALKKFLPISEDAGKPQ